VHNILFDSQFRLLQVNVDVVEPSTTARTDMDLEVTVQVAARAQDKRRDMDKENPPPHPEVSMSFSSLIATAATGCCHPDPLSLSWPCRSACRPLLLKHV
jgi:hypothetical protein